MGQTLAHGVYLPDNGERNCYTGLSQNWQKLDNLIGSHGDTVSFAQTLTEGVEIGKISINGVAIAMYSKDYTSELEAKADKTNYYTKSEVNNLIAGIEGGGEGIVLSTSIINMDNYVDITDTFNSLMDSTIIGGYYVADWEPTQDGWLSLNIDNASCRILVDCVLSDTTYIRLFDLKSSYICVTVPIQKNKKYRITSDRSLFTRVIFIPNT